VPTWALVRRLGVVLILGAATSCAAYLPEALELESVDDSPAQLEPDVRAAYVASEVELTEDDADPPLACLPEGFVPRVPAVPRYPEPSGETCRPIVRSTRARVVEDVRAEWMHAQDDSRLDIEFGCDRLSEVVEITVGSGSGHGLSLDLVRLRPRDDGLEWDVLLLRHSASVYMAEDRGAGVYRGRVSADAVADALALSRAAMLLEVEERVDDSRTSGLTSSSGDFHAFVRLVDDRGEARVSSFTGYPGSTNQPAWLIGALAVSPLDHLVEAATLEPASPDADSRRFFMERYFETKAETSVHGYTWPLYRIVEMAGANATLDLIPSLAPLLCEIEHRGTPRVDRFGAPALISILALLGHDEPVIPGEPLDRHQAARWRAACHVTCS
jgi:hypothetical protein